MLSAVQDRVTVALIGLLASLPVLDHPVDIGRELADGAYAEAARSAVNGLAT